jgi:REP element-mobilizing transposase RayT
MEKYDLLHICIKSENELMHREEEDYRSGISKMALAAHRTGTHIFAFAFMSTHVHMVVQSPDISRFVSNFRNSYTKWFNYKYSRTGRLGERYYHTETLDSLYRILHAVNYVLRNPVHHLVTDTAIGYEFCSARYMFPEDLNVTESRSNRRCSRCYPGNVPLPKSLWLNEKGMISPKSFLEISAVERLYMTAKNYMFYINRPSYADLDKPKAGEKPLTISHIEPAYDLGELQTNEHKRSVKEFTKDVEICRLIDKEILSGRSYAQLTDQEKKRVAALVSRRLPYCPLKQIYRCLAIQVPA